ncbi:putative mitochondrial protein [Trifolium repens]|nr:putative mitochondrial protein [Trifolium repens]
MPARLQECEITADNEVTEEGDLVHLAFMGESESINVNDALKDEKWVNAMKEELDSIESNHTWELVDLPHKKKAIDVKWVYKLKLNSKGEVTRHKARLVARGILQKEGIDYDEVFAHVTRMETIRLVTAIANMNDWPMYQMDVKSAFLNGPIEEEVYVTQPPGFVVQSQKSQVYKLNKALYGLKQAPRAWNRRIDKFLSDIGFVKCVTEHGVYVKKGVDKGIIVLCLYVDDLLITGSDEGCISEFKEELKREFEMTDLGHISYFLGIEFLRTENGILLHQSRYASEILKKFEMDKCNVVLSPAEPRFQLSSSENEKDVDPTYYRKLIGSLRYLCNTRPDIAYNVGIVSRFMEKPKTSHLIAVKRILRYVKGTIECGILFPTADRQRECKLIGYTDSNWCGDIEDRKSTAGYVFYYGGAPISWCSKKEPVVALSSCEAEYIVASLSTCQAVWLKILIEEISQAKLESVVLKIDNVSAINLAKNPIAHGRSKHIELRFHYLRE